MPKVVLLPSFSVSHFCILSRITLICTVLAGFYGAIHDQISFTISEEYFTKMKFDQFRWADFGLPARLFAALIGFLATWWIGLIGGWILGRIGLAELKERTGHDFTYRAFSISVCVAAVIGLLGALLGWAMARRPDLTSWRAWEVHLNLIDLPGFIVVAYLHWASYIGGLFGLMMAGIYVRRKLNDVRNSV